ncbi:MAG: VWA domain-containing protein [Chloroflexi bacterium]|nr:VWA domain-containing protein [Chloroflexota bacterium]
MNSINSICDLCLKSSQEEQEILSDLAHARSKSLDDLRKEMLYGMHRNLRQQAEKFTRERLSESEKKAAKLQERLKEREEELAEDALDSLLEGEKSETVAMKIAQDKIRKELQSQINALKWQPERLSEPDLEKALENLIEKGDLQLDKGKLKLTRKGARRLASYILKRVLETLARKDYGAHRVEEDSYGAELSLIHRQYEPGDDYWLVDVETTLLNAMKRNAGSDEKMSLKLEDFEVCETVHEGRMSAGLIIDQSGSMTGNKINAAIDASLALAELIRRQPKDSLKVFLFSDQVKQVLPWDVVNQSTAGGSTDIKTALAAFRRSVQSETADKQAYLITDTESNTENGEFVGFEAASAGIISEALHYRREGITLNIIMLDENPYLRELASLLARNNMGRVFFASPQNLGQVIIESYLGKKKGRSRWSAPVAPGARESE